MNILEIQNELMYDGGVWEEIKNDEVILLDAANLVKDDNATRFKAPIIVNYILNNREEVSPDVFNYVKDNIFLNLNIARGEIYNNITYLYQLFSSSNLMLRENEKRFAVGEALNAYKLVNSKMARTIHGIAPYDLKFQILMNPSWSEEEKKKLIYQFYRSDSTYYSALYNFYNFYDDNDSYKVKLFKFLSQNTPSSYEESLKNDEKKLVK